ncbi:lysosomal dipeptide transporter MFSD1 [Lepeophtheirus salmonis]|uniref:lysosomal dipeptide transporter MFSD1 n=1 Tax=Lepeophtheirus salmonis TaxID=72036 RepID=UPI001AE8B375|nr:major facilitator superfamily domain-containing protein 1-like [Lepeophtheirus salmonis]XP_040564004.1 major facilitator superfamily domain-containing protein 1-like [Lepeophtheirus salmonis]
MEEESSSSDRDPIIPEVRLRPDEEIVIPGWGGSILCHPQKLPHKILALFFMCLLGFGSYYCYDNPGALQKHFIKDIPMTTLEFASLYSWYSWPNVALPIIGGYLIDTIFGIRLGAIIFGSFICAGQLVFATGGLHDSTALMQTGRFIFGIGGESLAVAQNTYAASWFSGDTLNRVFGFQISIARFGSSVNYWTVGKIYDSLLPKFDHGYTALGWTLMIASFTCFISLVSSIILGVIDKRAKTILKKDDIASDPISLKDIVKFPLNFWLLSTVCVTYYVTVFPFVSLAQVFLMKKYNLGVQEANVLTGLVYLISAFASPILGYIIDKVGRNLTFVLTAVFFTLLAHMMLAFTFWNPYIPICVMGMSYSLLASALWPICTLIVPIERLGTAFGIMQAIQNLGLAIVPLGAGVIVDNYGYIWLEIYFIFWLTIAIIATLTMWLIDLNFNDSFLNMDAGTRNARTEALKKQTPLNEGDPLPVTSE